MTTEEISELMQKYGQAKENVYPGDLVLIEGSLECGEYVTLCKVLSIEDNIVKYQKEHTYYLNGGEYPERKVSSVSVDYFKKSIIEHIQKGRDVFQKISDAFEATSE